MRIKTDAELLDFVLREASRAEDSNGSNAPHAWVEEVLAGAFERLTEREELDALAAAAWTRIQDALDNLSSSAEPFQRLRDLLTYEEIVHLARVLDSA